MEKNRFLDHVAVTLGAQDHDQVERVTTVVLHALQADSSTPLPHPHDTQEGWGMTFLARLLHRLEDRSALGYHEFLSHVADRAELRDPGEAARCTRAVFHALKGQITSGEAWRVARGLSPELRVIWLES